MPLNNSFFSFLQLNIRHGASAAAEVASYFINNNVSILAIQECYNRDGSPAELPPRSQIVFSGPNPFVCFVIDPSIPFSVINGFSDSHFVCVEVLFNGYPIYLINCYLQPSLDPVAQFNNLDRLISALRNRNFVMMGDFNARSTLWGDSLVNERGDLLSELIIKYSLFVHNSKYSGPTFSSHVGSSVIDLTISNMKDFFIDGWCVDRDAAVLSDHYMITFNLVSSKPTNADIFNTQNKLHYNFGKADWTALRRYINTCDFEQRFFSCFDINFPAHSITSFHNLIMEIVNLFVPLSNFSKFNYWWSPELTRLKKHTRFCLRKFQRRHLDDDRLAYKHARNRYVAAIRRCKLNWIMEKNLRDQRSGRSPWGDSFKEFFGKCKRAGYPNIDFLSQNCTRRALTDLLDDAFPDDSTSSDTPSHSILREQFARFSSDSVLTDDSISPAEVRRAVDGLVLKKSPGSDGIKACFWKKFYYFNNIYLNFLFNFCFTTGYFPREWKCASITFIPKSAGSSLRPISVLPSVGKIYEYILNNRLNEHATSKNLINDSQFGFRPGKSTLHALHKFRESYRNFDRHYCVSVAFLDISKAFDSAWWPSIFNILICSGCPPNLLTAIYSFFADRQVVLDFAGVSVSKCLTLGCPQGSILSPLLWNIFFDSVFDLPTHKFTTVIAYADDLTIMVPQRTALLSTMLLNDFLCGLHEWSQTKKITFSAKKSAVMVLRGPISWSPTIFLGGELLPTVSEYKFLGFLISRNFHFQKHITYLLRKGETRAYMLFRLLRSNKVLTFSNMLLLYKSVIIPSFTYGVSFWFGTALTYTYSRKFISLQRKCLISITGCLRTTSSEAIDIITGILPIMIYLDTLQARESLRIAGFARFGGFRFAMEDDVIRRIDADCSSASLTYFEFRSFLWDSSVERWNTTWSSSITGRFTFKFFPSVSARLSQSYICPRGPLARLLAGHSICMAYLQRFNISDVRLCDCDTFGDLFHDLYVCPQLTRINCVFSNCDPQTLTSLQLYPFLLSFSKDRESLRLSQLNGPLRRR